MDQRESPAHDAALRSLISQYAVARKSEGARIVSSTTGEESSWLFDFRALLLTPVGLDLAAEAFWDRFRDRYPFQVGGLETAGISLVAAIMMKGVALGAPVNGFYIRKSRKPDGLQKIVEGTLTADPIVLVDDLLNSGGSFRKQIEVLKAEGKEVFDVFAFVKFRPEEPDLGPGVRVTTLFTPTDFGLAYTRSPTPPPRHDVFTVKWAARGKKPNYFYRVPKSAPVLDEHSVYFGTDEGLMHALNQETGTGRWKFRIFGSGSKGKTIFSSPALHGGSLFFGAYDGNFYALDTADGHVRWTYADADWIGSSPCVADDLGLVYVGLEYGLWRKHGGIVALDAASGEKQWEFIEMPGLTHGSPAYSRRHGAVAIGCNDGALYLFRASDGALLWKFQSGGEIKAAPAFDEERGLVCFGSFDGIIYALDVRSGAVVFTQKTEAAIYSTPCIWQGRLFTSSLDKRIYCTDLDSGKPVWDFKTAGRVFASPAIAEGRLYVGSNDGRLYELDPLTGRNMSYLQATERITNKVAVNPRTKRFYLTTYANDIYCLERIGD